MSIDAPAPDNGLGCQNCGRPLDPANAQSAESGLCLECAVASAEARLDLQDEAPVVLEVSAEEKRSLGVRAAIAAGAVALAIVVIAWPALSSAGSGEQPARSGFADTDVTADECIENITILVELQEDGEAAEQAQDFDCPATDLPYAITWADGEEHVLVDVTCPDPSAHGLSSISMSVGDELPTVGE